MIPILSRSSAGTLSDHEYATVRDVLSTDRVSLEREEAGESNSELEKKSCDQGCLPSDDEIYSNLCDRCRELFHYASTTAMHGHHRTKSKFKGVAERDCRLCESLSLLGMSKTTKLYTHDIGNIENIRPELVGRSRAMSSGTHFTLDTLESSFATLHTSSGERRIAPRHVCPASIDYELVGEWIKRCKTRHMDQCSTSGNTNLADIKFIDCETGEITRPRPHKKCSYLALSYAWGATSSQPMEEHVWPHTILDSITLTLRLGYRYLWVDRYCIDQTNEVEKHRQIQDMGYIYNGAELTIIAAAGHDPHYGLPGIGARHREPQFRFKLNGIELLQTFFNDRQVERSPWASRAWTLQESFLSQRRLVFTDHEVIFVCSAMHHAESIRVGHAVSAHDTQGLRRVYNFGRDLLSSSTRPVNIYMAARHLLEQCSKRHLSFDTDALNVCLGILNYLRVHHWWGVLVQPPEEMHLNHTVYLDWSKDWPGRRREGFPSWSWTSVEGLTYMSSLSLPQDNFGNRCIEVPLRDGTRETIEDWSRSGACIVRLGPKGCLRITGSIMDLQFIRWKDFGDMPTDFIGLPAHFYRGKILANSNSTTAP